MSVVFIADSRVQSTVERKRVRPFPRKGEIVTLNGELRRVQEVWHDMDAYLVRVILGAPLAAGPRSARDRLTPTFGQAQREPSGPRRGLRRGLPRGDGKVNTILTKCATQAPTIVG